MIFHPKPDAHAAGMRPGAAAFLPNRYDVFAFAILFGVFIATAHGSTLR